MSKLCNNILIAGATGGIGRELASFLHQQGYRCILTGRNEEKLRSLASGIGNAPYFVCDLASPAQIAELFVFLKQQKLKLNGMIHCAGLSPLMSVAGNDDNAMRKTFQVNFFSFITLMQHFQEEEISCDKASVVAMSSVTSHTSSPRQTIYAASKAALDTAIHCMAKEFLPRKIRVNSVVAGPVNTEMLQELAKQSPGLQKRLDENCPLGVIPVEQVVYAIEYLLSPRAASITGTNMVVDSGFLIQR